MTYIIKTNGSIDFYYYNKGAIHKRRRTSSGFSEAVEIISGVKPDFTLSLDDKDSAYIFCTAPNGDLMTVRETEKGTVKKIILENKENRVASSVPIYFDALIENSGINLIYNVPSGGRGRNNLYLHILNGEKTSPQLLDTVLALRDTVFRTCRIGQLRTVVYIQGRKQTSLCYREILENKVGSLNIVFSGGPVFSDYSVMGNSDGMYFLTSVSNVFSSRLLFRKRTSQGFSQISTAAEMNMISFPLVFSYNDKIYFFFKSGNRAYLCSEGERPKSFGGKICQALSRAVYIDRTEGSKIKASEALVDAEKPWDIQVFPEIDENFLNTSPAENPKGEYRDYNFMDFFVKKGRRGK